MKNYFKSYKKFMKTPKVHAIYNTVKLQPKYI